MSKGAAILVIITWDMQCPMVCVHFLHQIGKYVLKLKSQKMLQGVSHHLIVFSGMHIHTYTYYQWKSVK